MSKIEKLKGNIQANVNDPRRQYGNLLHKLETIIIIGICSIICGGEDYTDMEEFGRIRIEWLRKFLDLRNGIPDSDTFRRVFERLNPDELSLCLFDWFEAAWKKRSVIAVDGKTIKGSANNEHKAYHVVSAFVTENQITFGELAVDEKSNEITAVPELLDLLDIEGAIITADAMSCQKKITQKITEKKADYVLALKENQPALYENVTNHFSECALHNSHILATNLIETDDTGHGRKEHRTYYLETDILWLDCAGWSNLNSVGYVKSQVTENGVTREYIRYFITSLTSADEFAFAVRKHWSIENQLHWNLDVIFREDASRARKDNSPLNLNVLRKTSLVLLKNIQPPRVSIKKLMFRAALDISWLEKILFSPIK